MSMQDNLPSLGWLSTLLIAVAGAVLWCFRFVSATTSALATHDQRLARLEADLSDHLKRLEGKIDKVILHLAGMRNAD